MLTVKLLLLYWIPDYWVEFLLLFYFIITDICWLSCSHGVFLGAVYVAYYAHHYVCIYWLNCV